MTAVRKAGLITSFCIFSAMVRVRSAVEPPAPHVMSQKVGPRAAMRLWRSCRLCTPSSVLGGKYSKEKNVSFAAIFSLILSIIFMVATMSYNVNEMIINWWRKIGIAA